MFERIELVLQSLSVDLGSFEFLAPVRLLLEKMRLGGLPVVEISLHPALGDLHSAHLGRLLQHFLPEGCDLFVTLRDLGEQNFAFMPGITHLLFDQKRTLLAGCRVERHGPNKPSHADLIGRKSQSDAKQNAGSVKGPDTAPCSLSSGQRDTAKLP